MGKKARKTRWKALSIEEPRSDCSSPIFENTKSYSSKTRYGGLQNGTGAHHKYPSSHSTPTHQLRQHRDRWALQKDQGKTTTSTRSNSTCSENKITFNEDEYTKITTPRQDVLFKKGYLSKPKPYLQRPLTSAGTSTGDGTPDHQSADGADYPENDFDVFPYPNVNSDAIYNNPNVCFYESTAPMILYDNYGNSVVYYPPPVAGLPPHHHYNSHDNADNKKRYSIDSASQNTTPNNETNENYENISEPEVFEGARIFPDVAEVTSDPQKPETTSSDDKNVPETCKSPENVKETENIAENCEKSENSDEESTKYKYRVDAEEFVPRGFVPNYNFVPFCPPEFFGGHFVILPPNLPPFNNFYPVQTLETTEQTTEQETTDETVQNGGGQGIDIQKIVSKLEQAAHEQNQRTTDDEVKENEENDKVDTIETNEKHATDTKQEENTLIVVGELIKPEEKIEVIVESQIKPPELVQKYSDRLKCTASTTKAPKTVPRVSSKAPPSSTNTHKNTQNHEPKTCPRLHRQSSKNNGTTTAVKGTSGPEISSRNFNTSHSTHSAANIPKHTAHSIENDFKIQNKVVDDLNDFDVISGTVKGVKLQEGVQKDTSDSWVSVNSRKKRKNPKNKTNETTANNLGNSSDSSDQNTDLVRNLVHSEPAPTIPTPADIAPAQSEVPEVETVVKITSTSGVVKKEIKTQKENKNKSIGGKKPNKKRVLVTDECLGNVLGQNREKEAVGSTETAEVSKPEEVEIIPGETQNEPTEPTLPVLPPVEPKKPKKKRNKPKTDVSSTLTDSDLNISNSSDSLGLLETSGHSTVPVDVSEVELELEKMIQRGLYANLEQKLGKSDSFLGNLNTTNPFGSLFSPPKLLNNSILPFPQIVVPKNVEETTKIPKIETPEPESISADAATCGTSGKLSVTEAVKKWIDKTRETTPEVEIFRKPEEIREGMLNKVLNIDEEELSDGSVESEVILASVDDAEIDRTAKEASSLIETRSRSNSIDIMEFWDDELLQQSAGPPGTVPQDLEHAEDALDALETVEVYQSVYGTAGDFQRIRNEVNSVNSSVNSVHSSSLRGSRFFNRNQSLPYRAICCSVM